MTSSHDDSEVQLLRAQITKLKQHLEKQKTPFQSFQGNLLAELQEKNQEILRLKEFEEIYKKCVKKKIFSNETLENTLEELELEKHSKQSLNKELQETKARCLQLGKLTDLLKTELKTIEEKNLVFEKEKASKQASFLQLNEELVQTKVKLQEKEKTLQEKKRAYEEALTELQSLQGQYSQLREVIESLKIKNEEQATHLQEKEKHSKEILDKNHLLKENLTHLETELDQIKQALNKTLIETKELEEQFLDLLQEKTATLNRSLKLQQTIETLQEESASFQEALKKTLQEKETLEQQLAHVLSELNDQKEHYLDLEACFNQCKVALHQLEEDFHTLNDLKKDSEAELKIAQQHLAKKVKEMTLLNDSHEEQKQQTQELKQKEALLYQEIESLKHFQEQASLNIKKEQEQLKEELKIEKELTQKAQKNYQEALFQLNLLKEDISPLRKIETKYLELKRALGHLTESIEDLPAPKPPLKEEALSPLKTEKMVIEPVFPNKIEPIPSSEDSLFERPQAPFKVKESLFD